MPNPNDTKTIEQAAQNAWRRDSDAKPETNGAPAPKQDGANPFVGMPGMPPTTTPATRKDAREQRQDDGGRG